MEAWSAQRLDVKLRAAGRRPASSGAPLAAHPIMPVQVARRRANSGRGSRLGRRERRWRTVNFNDELGAGTIRELREILKRAATRLSFPPRGMSLCYCFLTTIIRACRQGATAARSAAG